jgi:hypothetical protein
MWTLCRSSDRTFREMRASSACGSIPLLRDLPRRMGGAGLLPGAAFN